MKPIWNKLLGILLGLLLATGSWVEVHAPSAGNETMFPVSPATTQLNLPEADAAIGKVPTAIQASQPIMAATATQEKTPLFPNREPATAGPPTQVTSCSNDVVGSEVFVWPTDNHSLSGNDYGPGHPGIDLTAGEGSPVYAADAGVVVALGDDPGGYGNLIQIDHHNGYFTLYGHLSVIGVGMCQSVQAGEWIGAAGSTGNASGAHLHFGVEKDGWAVDPWTVLP